MTKAKMKKLLPLALICITLLNAACTRTGVDAKTNFPAACGGYTEYRIPTDEETVLFNTVYLSEPALTPYAVATQVVAGTNYRFLCHDAAEQEYVVIIFVPLPCYADTQQPKVTQVQFPTPKSLTGTWFVHQTDDIVLTEEFADYPVITFRDNGLIVATAGCNGMSGQFTYEDGRLTITDGMGQTEMWCENEEMMRNERIVAETLFGTLEVSAIPDNRILLKGKHTLVLAR